MYHIGACYQQDLRCKRVISMFEVFWTVLLFGTLDNVVVHPGNRLYSYVVLILLYIDT